MDDYQIEITLDETTSRAIVHKTDTSSLRFFQCSKCAALYLPDVGHECKNKQKMNKTDVLRAVWACMFDGCSKCPYRREVSELPLLLNGSRVSYSCKVELNKDFEKLLAEELKEK